MNKIKNSFLWRMLDRLMSFRLIASSIILTLTIGICVFVRYILHSDIYGSDEIITLFALWLYWIGAAYGSLEDSHITADMLDLFIKNPKILWIKTIFVKGFTTATAAILAYWGVGKYLVFNIQNFGYTTALKMPMLLTTSAISIGLFLCFVYSLFHFIAAILSKPADYLPKEE